LEVLYFVLGIPLAGGVVLALFGHRNVAMEINVGFSLATFLATCVLTAQVIGFLAMENGLFFAATSATYGMPMVVELGIALDVLIGVLILGVFMFQIREQFDSLDIRHLEKLKED
jgi:hydrogenase-4 component E